MTVLIVVKINLVHLGMCVDCVEGGFVWPFPHFLLGV